MKKHLLFLLALCQATLFAAAIPSTPPPADFKPQQSEHYVYGRGWIYPPLPSNTKTVEVTVFGFKHNAKTELAVEVMERAFFYKPVTLFWGGGRNKFRVRVEDFKPRVPYGIDWNFSHAVRFLIPPELGEVRFVRPVEFHPPRSKPWYEIADPKPPKKIIGGRVWTEGLSFTGLGRYPNSQRAENLTETVFGDSFQLLLSETDRCNFLMRPAVAPGSKFKEKVDIDFIKRVVTNTGSKGEVIKVTASNAAPGFLIDTNVPMEILYTGLQRSKVIEGYVGEDTTDFIKHTVKHNLNPKQRAKFRCSGILLPGTGKIAAPATVKTIDFAKLSEPWVVMIWDLPNHVVSKGYWHKNGKKTALLITAEGKAVFADGAISLDKGTVGISGSFNNLLPANPDPAVLSARASQLAKMLRNYPQEFKEFYHVTDKEVMIRNEFKYRAWGDKKFRAADYAPIPPVLAANSIFTNSMKLPVTQKMLDEAFATMHGPYTFIPGSVLDYTMTRFPFDHALPPSVADSDEELKQAEFVIKNTPPPFHGRPYKTYREIFGMDADVHRVMPMNNMLCWGSYSAETRKHITDMLKLGIERSCSEHLWLNRKEMHTNRPYILNGWPADVIDAAKGRYYQGDANTMNSSVWFGLYMYGKYSGDWDFVREKMPLMKALYIYDEMVNAWDNPGPSGRDHIHLTEIDMDTISAMGLGALEKIARTLGDKEFEDRAAYVRVKSLNCCIAKIVFDRWLLAEDDPRRELAVMRGFFANFANFRQFKNIPAGVGSISTEATWSNWFTTQPELPLELARAVKPEFIKAYQERLLRLFPVFTSFPEKNHTHPWDYEDMVFNSLEVLLALGEVDRAEKTYDKWFRQVYDGKYSFWRQHWKGTSLFHGSYAGTIARLRAAKYGFELRDWEPAVITVYRLDKKTMTVHLELESKKAFTLRFRSVKKPMLEKVVKTAPEEYSLACKAGKTKLTIPLK